ncbi:hypothetical protein D9613_002096 [Agrocybe pediades]|uniref:AB hydrolase-1 domain-containing protein n=1 Tax=Agrocybe pediades TaxID=84607 RepID=A0A8H4R6S3_9AGAR|nr:hypothetical protein D9613_002096 [Agrocybe pediades]
MDIGYYKTLTTSRGFTYSYYFGIPSAKAVAELDPGDPPLPALLFLHGFPTSSRLWKHQAKFFQQKGFIVLAPDLLGCGESSKPLNVEAYRPSLVCRDIVEIIDHEHLETVIPIGHDIGSRIVSRLSNFHSERFIAFGFISVPYIAPRPQSKIDFTLKITRKMCGYELLGHLIFYAEPGADQLILAQLGSFFSVIFPEDPKLWVTQVAPIGALKSWLERGGKTKIASYLAPEDLAAWRQTFCRDGVAPALCWHKARLNAEDDGAVPLEKYPIEKPVFYAAANHDYISLSILGIATINHNCPNATIREFHGGHWLMLSSPDELNAALFSWIMDCI